MHGSGEMTGDSTRCVHSSLDPEVTTGSVHTPIFQTSTYVQNDFADHLGYEYARGDNPTCLLYTSPSPRDATLSRMPSSA